MQVLAGPSSGLRSSKSFPGTFMRMLTSLILSYTHCLVHQQETKTAEIEKSSSEAKEVEEIEEVEAASSTSADEQKDETPSADPDAELYPSRTPLAGGWAGGEVGLKQFVQVLWLRIFGASVWQNE